MLREAVQYLVTPCRPEFRKLGYLHELIALEARYQRLQAVWRPHIEQCRQLILQAAEACARRRKVIVLGSGLLIEVPVEALAQRFEQVVLVDVVHLKSVRERVAALDNVELVEADITGLAGPVLQLKASSQVLPGPQPQVPGLDTQTDLVVSANLLSQLCNGPLHHTVPRLHLPDHAYIDWCLAIIEAHLQSLLAAKARICLITDLVHVQTDRQGQVLEREDVLYGLTLPDAARTWEWELAPYGEASRRYKVTAVVCGFANFPLPYK